LCAFIVLNIGDYNKTHRIQNLKLSTKLQVTFSFCPLYKNQLYIKYIFMSRYISRYLWTIFRRFRKSAKSDCSLRHACPSVRPHGKNRLPLDGFF